MIVYLQDAGGNSKVSEVHGGVEGLVRGGNVRVGFSACMQTPQALLPGEPASGHLTSLSHCTLDTEVGGVENVEQVGQSPPKKNVILFPFSDRPFTILK